MARKNNTPSSEYEEVPGNTFADFFPFNEIGDNIEGALGKQRVIETSFGPQTVYDLIDDTGKHWTIGCTADLEAKLPPVPMGTLVNIELKELRPIKGRKQPFKLFSVKVPKGTQLQEVESASEFFKERAEEGKRARKGK